MPTMRIVYEQQFASQLKAIIAFIARDNPAAARSFRNNLKHRIEQLPDNPPACRQSTYFTDSNLRDLIFMGYCYLSNFSQRNPSARHFQMARAIAE